MTPPSGVIAWWPFDELSGTTAEDVVGGNTGTHSGGPIPVAGRVGGALDFDGSDDLVVVPDNDLWAFGPDEFTIEFWANFDGPANGTFGHPGDVFISHDEGPFTRNKWFFALSGDGLEFHVNGPGVGSFFAPIAPFAPTPGQWHHLALTRTGTSYSIYADGVLLATDTNAANIPNPAAPLTIGATIEPFGGFFDGRLDEMTIYDGALLQSEIQAIYDAGSAGKCKEELRIRPDRGGDTGLVTVQIFGSGFTEGATVRLVRDGEPDIVADPVTVENNTTIVATFDLTGAARGLWDVVVMNPDGTIIALSNNFTVEEGRVLQLWVDIVGPTTIRRGRPQTFWALYGNSGNINIYDAYLEISISQATDFDLQILPLDSEPPDLEQIDTPIHSEVSDESVIPLWVYSLAAGSTNFIPLVITIPLDY